MADLLQDYLDGDESQGDGLAKVMAHANLLRRVAGIYLAIAPAHLAQVSRVANFKSGIVVIHTESGAVASKLRQMTRTLVEQFLKKGLECHGVQIKVQAGQEPRTVAYTPSRKPLGEQTFRELATLSDSLPASPLRSALERLLARAAKRE